MRRRGVRALLQRYGADPGRWPEQGEDVAAIGAFGPRRDEAALDAALDRFTAPAPGPELLARIVARAAVLEQERPRAWPAFDPAGWAAQLGAHWPRVAALAAAVVLGLVVGWSDPWATPPPAVAEDLVVVSMLDGLE